MHVQQLVQTVHPRTQEDINENLSWNAHIEKLSKKVASGIGALKRIRPYVSFRTIQLRFTRLG